MLSYITTRRLLWDIAHNQPFAVNHGTLELPREKDCIGGTGGNAEAAKHTLTKINIKVDRRLASAAGNLHTGEGDAVNRAGLDARLTRGAGLGIDPQKATVALGQRLLHRTLYPVGILHRDRLSEKIRECDRHAVKDGSGASVNTLHVMQCGVHKIGNQRLKISSLPALILTRFITTRYTKRTIGANTRALIAPVT